MLNQFSRTELILGAAAMEKLANSKVAVIGLGASGAACAEALARSAVGCIALLSGETVTDDMLGGSIIANRETLGLNTVDVAEKRLLSINSEIKILKNPLPEATETPDFSGCDYVVNTSFDLDLTAVLAARAQACDTPIISVLDFGGIAFANAEFKIADVNKIPQAKSLGFELRRAGVKKHRVVYPVNVTGGASQSHEFAGINACALGLIAAGEVIKGITGVTNNGKGA